MKKFNITGTCIEEKHYMVNIENKLKKIMMLVEEGEYFVINRPRQYGKTTTLYLLNKKLMSKQEYLPIKISFEGIDSYSYENTQIFLKTFVEMIGEKLEFQGEEELSNFVNNEIKNINTMKQLSKLIAKTVKKSNKKIVLMIDEVDKSSNNQLFLDFLAMLRSKYLSRNEGEDYTFHSVILAGVHDVKSLKIKIRLENEQKYNSPWNIATDFDIDMSFSKEEIMTMMDEYCSDKEVKMDKEYFAERLYFYTSGYPFLVSKLCKTIDEKIMIEGKKWKKEYMDKAVKELLRESNTNFEGLIKNLENNSKLKELVNKLIIDGSEITFNKDNPIITLGIIYGIFKNEQGKLKIHNRIYEQRIYDYMSSLIETSTNLGFYNTKANFIKEDGSLDIRKILIKFQEFMKHEYSQKREAFLEDDGRLIFLAFLSPIINGTGFAFKEVRGGEEKRFDIVITYEKKMYILELKIWYGEEYHKKGLIQLGEYLGQYGLEEGYLLIFDFRKNKSLAGKVEEVQVKLGEKDKNVIEFYC